MPHSRRLALLAALCAAPLTAVSGQCPDGSPPPCAAAAPRATIREAPRAVDANRIAVLPFRVTTSDSLLGEGFAELLATEFSSADGPRAIDMATVISAWRRAGGGLRTPLPRDRALVLARQLGAGLVSEGSIVGLGKQITITTNLISSTNGQPRGRPTRITASADSIDAALRQTASGMVAALGGQQRLLEGARYTESPEAMRHYLEALSLWRRGKLQESQAQLERAMVLDTLFAQPALRSHLAAGWSAPPTRMTLVDINRRTFMLRDRLSAPERMLVEAIFGPNFHAPHPHPQRIAAHSRVAALMPDMPEAQFLAGDAWFHYGALVDPVNMLARAYAYIARSAAIDSQATALRHLLEIAVRQRDTAALRKILPAYARTEDTGRWPGLFLGWSIVGDERQLAPLRRSPLIDNAISAFWPIFAAATADVPAARLDEMITLWSDAFRGTPMATGIAAIGGTMYAMRGRPAMAERLWATLPPDQQFETDRTRLMFALSDDGEGLDVAGAAARIGAMIKDAVAPNSPAACELILWRKKQGVPLGDTTGRFGGSCGRTLALTRLDPKNPETIGALEATDSTMRNFLVGGQRGYEPVYLARAWEAAGRPDRGLTATRYHQMGSYLSESVWITDEEARLALVAGDTTAAIRALEYFLPVIADAEPAIAAKRDSLRTLLAGLKRRR